MLQGAIDFLITQVIENSVECLDSYVTGISYVILQNDGCPGHFN